MILLLLLVFIRYYIGRGRLLFCPCSGCKAASLTELGVGYARENSPLRSLLQCDNKVLSGYFVRAVTALTVDCVTPARIPSSATGKLFYIKLDFRRLTSPVFSDREVREILNIF